MKVQFNHEERSLVLSTLTKILIVLLSLFSIFLCGTVVTYIGNANNYRALYEEAQGDMTALTAEKTSAQQHYNEQVQVVEDIRNELNQSIQLLEGEKSKLMADLRTAERASLQYQARADSWQGIVTGFEQTIANLEVSLKTTQEQLDKVRKDDIQESKEFNELTARLYETIVQLEAVRGDKRRLLEAKSGLEEQLQQATGGRAAVVKAGGNVVTPVKGPVRAAVSMPETTDLKGLVTEVGETLVSVSIGSADGVEQNMIFHVTRGDDFICNVVITHVDTNKAAGVLDLKVDQPRIGDTVSTKL